MEAEEVQHFGDSDESGSLGPNLYPLYTVMDPIETAQVDRKRLLEDFRYLIEFVEQEILPLAALFDTSREADTSTRHKKTCFRDLWYLFALVNTSTTPRPHSRSSRILRQSSVETAIRNCGSCIANEHSARSLRQSATASTTTEKPMSAFQQRSRSITSKGNKTSWNCPCTRYALQKTRRASSRNVRSRVRSAEKASRPSSSYTLDGLTPESHSSLQYIASDVIIDAGEAMKVHLDWKSDSKYPSTNPGCRGYPEPSQVIFYWRIKNQKAVSSNINDALWIDDGVGRKEKIEYCETVDSFLSHGIKGKEKEYQLRGDDIALLPRRLFAYVLQERRFVAVDIRNLSSVKDSSSGSFESLVINPDHMSLLQSLVHSHFMRKRIQDSGLYSVNQDIVHNKGRGLVILLHGVPGIGKTSTAETIAHQWNKPLLPITYGHLGLSPSHVESKLKDIFRVAQLWGCILLLDEADVFLSERKATDLEIIGLVSGMLLVPCLKPTLIVN